METSFVLLPENCITSFEIKYKLVIKFTRVYIFQIGFEIGFRLVGRTAEPFNLWYFFLDVQKIKHISLREGFVFFFFFVLRSTVSTETLCIQVFIWLRAKCCYCEILVGTYLLQGSTQIPQHFSMPVRFFSASFMSAFIWSIPSSILSIFSENRTNQNIYLVF